MSYQLDAIMLEYNRILWLLSFHSIFEAFL